MKLKHIFHRISTMYTRKEPTVLTSQITFKVLSEGAISVRSGSDPAVKEVVLPKIGYALEMPKGFENVTRFEQSPWDSYADRKKSPLNKNNQI